jgi:hypothetical protein
LGINSWYTGSNPVLPPCTISVVETLEVSQLKLGGTSQCNRPDLNKTVNSPLISTKADGYPDLSVRRAQQNEGGAAKQKGGSCGCVLTNDLQMRSSLEQGI